MGEHQASRKLFFSPYSSHVVLAITIVAIVTMMFDVSLARVYDLIEKQPTSIWRVAIFVLITAVLIVSMFLILQYIGEKTAILGVSQNYISGQSTALSGQLKQLLVQFW